MNKPTDTNIAKYYGVSRETLRNYKNGYYTKNKVKVFTPESPRIYNALKEYFIKQN